MAAIWVATHETGDLSEWNPAQNSGNPPGQSVVQTRTVHTGKYAVKQSIDTRNGSAGTRLFRRDECRKYQTLDYSCWFWIPAAFTIRKGGWGLNVMQWKSLASADATNQVWWAIHLIPAGSGVVKAVLHERRGETVSIDHSQSVATIPLKTWFQLKARVKTAGDESGSITLWQDGALLLDLQGVQTAFTTTGFNDHPYNQDWSVDAYGKYLSPFVYRHFIDDAAQEAV